MAGKLDNRTGDQVPSESASAPTPQQVDGPEVGGFATSRPNKRPRRPRAASPVASASSQKAPDKRAHKAAPPSVDGPEVTLEAVKPSG